MKFEQQVQLLSDKKKDILESVNLCCDSISFWEDEANKLFSKMDELETEASYLPTDEIDSKYAQYSKEMHSLMNRIEFENNQLDILEKKLMELELRIVNFVKKYAKKQKK
tara:strand:+ start:1484 stop:1813 length:330 start_codon:yes stop_codon:yes gene_type:complete